VKRGAPVTIKDVAKRAGASLSTVSYVLNDNAEKFVSEELRRRVLQAAKELNYRPNQIARRLRGKTGKILAVLVPQFENVYFNRVVIGAQKVADERGYVLCIYSTYDDEERETDFIQNIVAQRVDGILLCPANNRTSAADLIREAGVPFVVIDREIAGADFDFVAIDNYQAAYAAAEYLIAQGHTRIAFCGWATSVDAVVKRREGFLAAAEKHGLSQQVTVWECDRDQHDDALYREGIARIISEFRPTALFIGQNQIAERIIRVLNHAPLNVPDLSVLLFGDPPWATITKPAYTCMAQPDARMGELATELLIARIEEPEKPVERILLQAELVERDSVHKLTVMGGKS
jgi:DNA-binding LacI/PurR family transcriptional regulator